MLYTLRKLSIIKTLVFNFKHFKTSVAIRLPVFVGKNVSKMSLNGNVYLDFPNDKVRSGMIKLGFSNLGTVDYSKERSIIENAGDIHFKGNADIGTGSRISNSGTLVFGEDFKASGKMTIICSKCISFGMDDLVSWDTLFMDSDLHSIIDNRGESNPPKPIFVGDHVWIGCNSIILKGTEIGSSNVIAAGSILNKKCLRGNCIIGTEGRILKQSITWKI